MRRIQAGRLRPALLGRSGMTLIEIMMSLTIFSVVMAAAMGFMRQQVKGFTVGTDRLTVVQNMRYAASMWGKDLRTVGANVPDEQPYMVLAATNAIAFNADFSTNVADDPWAVYYDPDAPTGSVTAMEKIDRSALPGGIMSYPDTNYKAPGSATVNSSAETIMFFFDLDTSTPRTDDYVMYRRVNNDAPAVVARHLLQTSGKPFFQYYRLVTPANAPQRIDTVPQGALPLQHTKAIHLSPGDTGGFSTPVAYAFARIDSIRGARISFTATNGATGAAERKRAITRLVWMPNAGLANRKNCGDEPILGGSMSFTSSLKYLSDGATVAEDTRVARLTWNPATDENSGEKDVARYVIWRKISGTTDWGDPIESTPAGFANYSFEDATVVRDDTYVFGLAAQDCTPRLSGVSTSSSVYITP